MLHPKESRLDVTSEFPGPVLPPIAFSDASKRLLTFCTSPHSGWVSYDLGAHHARKSGLFKTVTPWSMLFADALAGRISVRDITEFNLERRERFVDLIRAVPNDVNLQDLDSAGRDHVAAVCRFGFHGAWGPKITKVAALYLPRSVPVLDGYVALAFGFAREGFSSGVGPRHERILRVIHALGDGAAAHTEFLDGLRASVRPTVPEIDLISAIRLLDIVIWTSQDDRMSRAGKPADTWLHAEVGRRTPLEDVAPTPLRQPVLEVSQR